MRVVYFLCLCLISNDCLNAVDINVHDDVDNDDDGDDQMQKKM